MSIQDILAAHVARMGEIHQRDAENVETNARKLSSVIGNPFATVADLQDEPKPSAPADQQGS